MNRLRRQDERKGRTPSLPEYDRFSINLFLDRFPEIGFETDGARNMLLELRLTDRRIGFLELEGSLLDLEARFTGFLLAADPQGFSTTRRDLINDLLP